MMRHLPELPYRIADKIEPRHPPIVILVLPLIWESVKRLKRSPTTRLAPDRFHTDLQQYGL